MWVALRHRHPQAGCLFAQLFKELIVAESIDLLGEAIHGEQGLSLLGRQIEALVARDLEDLLDSFPFGITRGPWLALSTRSRRTASAEVGQACDGLAGGKRQRVGKNAPMTWGPVGPAGKPVFRHRRRARQLNLMHKRGSTS
eukprot:1294795-Amphidinium_carterae.5